MLKLRMINNNDSSDYFDLPFCHARIYNYNKDSRYFSSEQNNRVKLYEASIPFNQIIPNIPSYDELTSAVTRTYYWEKDTKLTMKVSFFKCAANITEATGVEEVTIECYMYYNKFAYYSASIGCGTPKPIAFYSGSPSSSYGDSVLIYDPINKTTGLIKTNKFLISNVHVENTSFTYKNCSGYPYQYEKNDEVLYTSMFDLNGKNFTKVTYSWEDILSVKDHFVFIGLQGALESTDTSGKIQSLYHYVKDYIPKYPNEDDEDDFPDGDKDDDSDDVDPDKDFPTSVARTGFVSMYAPTIEQLKSLASFMWSKDFLDVLVKLQQNPYEAIISIKSMKCDFEKGGSSNIILGNVDTKISCTEITSQYQQIDCGEISITRYFGNFLDYNPYTSIKIYLPFIGYRELDVDEVMNSKLHLYYNIDLLTGSCVAQLHVSKRIGNTNLNSVLYQFDGMIASEIPVTASDFTQVLSAIIRGAATTAAAIGVTAASGGAGASASGALLGSAVANNTSTAIGTTMMVNSAIDTITSKINVQHGGSLSGSMGALATKQPYIIIHRVIEKNPSNYAKLHGIPSNAYKILSSLTGFTKMQDIFIQSTIGSVDETEEIKQLLLGGVVI